ncbi:MAG TPA: hypothetical protein PLX89_27180, partial [Verrucomicrobiota bacterium]|nr:hypothetical protein [Verrucomicrobiota bacterium]
SDAVIAAQFVEWDKPDHRDARRVVRSLAFQLATRLPDYRKLLLTLPEIAELDRKDPAELFDYLLANPLRSVIGGGRERQLIVIDALDEAGSASAPGEAGRNPLVEMLARHAPRLPDWLGLVVTSRPESAVQTPLQGLNPFVLDTRTEANRADLRDYLRQKFAPQLHGRPDAARLIGQILEKSEGVFLYVERFCDDVQQNHLSLDRPDQFPQGLGGIFCQWFQRQFPDLEKFRQDVRPALRAILAAREPLPVEILQRLFNWQDEELRDFTRTLGSLFPVAKEANGEVIKPYHKSLADWLTDEAKAGANFVSEMEGHKMLAPLCWGTFQTSNWPCAIRGNYLLQHLHLHLGMAGLWQELKLAIQRNAEWFKPLSPNTVSVLESALKDIRASGESAAVFLANMDSLPRHFGRCLSLLGCAEMDGAAVCPVCVRNGLFHGNCDEGGPPEIDWYANHHIVLCPHCLWSSYCYDDDYYRNQPFRLVFNYNTSTYESRLREE